MVDKYILLYAVCILYSRIVLCKLKPPELVVYRKEEKLAKKVVKLEADITYLECCATNQLLPKFTNFSLYDVTAVNEPETIKFKKSLLQ